MTIPSAIGSPGNNWVANSNEPHTFTYDCGSTGSDRLLLIGIISEDELCTAVTYDGQTMAKAVGQQDGHSQPNESSIWTLDLGSITGSNDLIVTTAAANADLTFLGEVFQDADTTTIVGQTDSKVGNSDPGGGDETTPITNDAVDSVFVVVGHFDGGSSTTEIDAAASHTMIVENPGTSHTSRAFVTGMYSLDAATVQSYNVGYAIDPPSAKDWAFVAAEILAIAAAGGGVAAGTLSMMGVGI